jgi:hypothetical protein
MLISPPATGPINAMMTITATAMRVSARRKIIFLVSRRGFVSLSSDLCIFVGWLSISTIATF